MNDLSIQEIRQALRERGANTRGSKKQLMQRMAEQYGFQSINGGSSAPAAKVRVTIQKNRNEACMLLLDPSLPPETNIQQIRSKVSNKFRFKATHLYVIQHAGQGNGIELTSDNLKQYLKDNLIVLGSTMSKFPSNYLPPSSSPALPSEQSAQQATLSDDVHPQEPSMSRSKPSSVYEGASQEPLRYRDLHSTDSGSCSSENELFDLEQAERASLKSFDEDSLYSYDHEGSSSVPASVSNPTGGGGASSSSSSISPTVRSSSASSSHKKQSSNPVVPKQKGWKWMLPKSDDQLHEDNAHAQEQHLSPIIKPRGVPLQPAYMPPFNTNVPHAHRNHKCDLNAAASTSASPVPSHSTALTALAEVADTETGNQPLPSLLDEINGTDSSSSAPCACCIKGCEIDFSLHTPAAASPPPNPSLSLLRSHSTPNTLPPSSSSSSTVSSNHVNNNNTEARIRELEKQNRRLDSSLKVYLKSDLELRNQVANLSAGQSIMALAEKEFRELKLNNEIKDKEMEKLTWQRDQLKLKNKTLMDKNNTLKTDSEALEALKKEHAVLQQRIAHLNGENINASTSAATLQELLILHAMAIQRIHHQIDANIKREKKELQEARMCKVCMSVPSDTILLPCSHFVLCGHCASGLIKCPICRKHIDQFKPVYM